MFDHRLSAHRIEPVDLDDVPASRFGISAGAGFVVHPPEVFYPLGPEISHQWFRVRPRVALDEALSPATRVVHWYASVENRALYERIDPAYVRAHAERQLFSALVRPFV